MADDYESISRLISSADLQQDAIRHLAEQLWEMMTASTQDKFKLYISPFNDGIDYGPGDD